MEINLLQNNLIPIVIFCVGLFILSLNLFSLISNRKVIIKDRTNKKDNIIIKAATNAILSLFRRFDFYGALLDKAQFVYGYFSATSEKVNREKAEKIILNTVITNVIVIIAIILFNTTWIIKFFSVLILITLEYVYMSTSISKRKNKLQQQFPILVREFIEGYVLTSNVRASFEYSIKELPPIYKVHVNRLINQLSSVTGSEEAFEYFNRRLDYSMAAAFLSLVQSAYSTKKNVVENLLELQTMVNEENVEKKANRRKVTKVTNNIYLWIVTCVGELVGVGYFAKTSTGNYFLTTPLGQTLLISTLCFIILGMASIKISESV